MTRTTLSALLSYWRRHPLQILTLTLGLALATALWSGVQAINAEARASYDAAAATLGEGQFGQILAEDRSEIPLRRWAELRRAGWLVSPVIEGRVNGVRIVGLDPLTAPGGLGPVQLSGGPEVGAFLGGAGQVFGTAEALAALGDTAPEKIAAPDVAPMTVVTDLSVAQALLNADGATRLLVAPDQPMGRPSLDDIAPDLTLRPPQDVSDVTRLTDSFHLNLTAFGFLSFAVGLFIVHGAIGLAFEERRGMVRTLRALGLPLRRLVILMVAELLAIALIAGLIGVALGYFIAALLLPDVAATLSGLYGAQVSGTLALRPVWWLSGLGIALLGTLIASADALWRIARMPLLASAQPRAWAMTVGKGLLLRLALAAGLLVASALLLQSQGLTAGFAALACLLVGGALALPLLLSAILAFASGRAKGPLTQWFWADTRQQLPGLSLALMALLLAMAANVGVSTMVSSFRLTFTGFLDQRLASELYIQASDAAEARAVEDFLALRADAVLPIISAERRIEGWPAEVYGVRTHPTYSENWQLLAGSPAAWDAVFAGEATVINEQLFRRAGISVGQLIDVGGTALPVAGVVGDYGNPVGQVIIGEALYGQLFPDTEALRFGIRTRDPEGLTQALTQEFGLPAAQLTDQTTIKAFSLRIFERTFAVTGALNVLTLSVAGFAMLMSLLTLAAMRVPQLAPVWAQGLTRRRLGTLELIRAAFLAGFTAIAALPLGLALAWILLARVNVAAFGWRLPMYLFWDDYGRLLLFALLAALLAALWPARRLARTPPADLLKVFSNER